MNTQGRSRGSGTTGRAQRRETTDAPGFSFAKLTLYSLGSGVLVLLVSIPIIMVLTRVSSVAALVVGLLALVLMVAVIGLVSHRMISAVERQVRGESGADGLGDTP